MEELSACPGIGPTKVRRLYETFHEPFRRTLQQPAAEAADAGGDRSQAGTGVGAGSQSHEVEGGNGAGGVAPAAVIANDRIAEIGGDEDETDSDETNAGDAFVFL